MRLKVLHAEDPWLSLVQVSLVMNHASDQSGAAILPGRGGTALSAVVLFPPAAPASVARGWLPSVDVIVPYKTKLQRSGFYLVLLYDKFLPHSTASAAATCWGPIC